MRVYERLGKTTPQVFDESNAVVKEEGDENMTSTPAQETKEEANVDVATESTQLPLFTPTASPQATPISKKGPKKEPYRGLFEATLDLDSDPSVWRIKDLRDDVTGGVKEWRERACCLFCTSLLD